MQRVNVYDTSACRGSHAHSEKTVQHIDDLCYSAEPEASRDYLRAEGMMQAA